MNKKIEKILSLITDKSGDAAIPLLHGLGFKEAARSLTNIQILLGKGAFRSRGEELLRSAAGSPAPDLALNNLERVAAPLPENILGEIVSRGGSLTALCTLCGGSRFLTNIVMKEPSLLSWLIVEGNISRGGSFEEKVNTLKKLSGASNDLKKLQQILRDFKRREYLRIGIRDLLGLATLTEVMEEISDLASASLQIAYEASRSILTAEFGNTFYDDGGVKRESDFVILGMGKLGGRELNFSSDIDLIFLYTTDDGETGGILSEDGRRLNVISFHQYFVKLGEMIIKALNEITGDGFVFRVDMNLRPEGQYGDLACSVISAEIYYESWGRTWERSAMLKARPVAGDVLLGDSFLDRIMPFKFRKYLDFGAIEEIREMKKKIDAAIARDDQTLTNLKLGTGGIREIEFFVQALQLINGGRNRNIRDRNTLTALKELCVEGLVAAEDLKMLEEAYRFLRLVEHRLQIFQERQTHTIPADPEKLEKLARRAGYRRDPLEEFITDHKKHTGNVKKIYSRLFHEPAEKLKEDKQPDVLELLEGGLGSEEALGRLSSYGFEEPQNALRELALLWNGPPFYHISDTSRATLRRVAPFIFREITSSPEPDMALQNFEKFLSSVGARGAIYSLLAENHNIIKLLVGMFGTSSFLSKILLAHPETLDSLVSPGASSLMKSREEMMAELKDRLGSLEHFEDKLDAMRRFRNVEILRIGMNDIYGQIDIGEVSSQLSALADISLETALNIAMHQMNERFGLPMSADGEKPVESSFVVIGMGKLGGCEMTYSSDLDIIFVYLAGGQTSGELGRKRGLKIISNHEFFAKVAQSVISILGATTKEGYVFKVDTRLRPSGSSGPLVSSLEALREYHNKGAQTWERQAFTRARLIAGDAALGGEVFLIIEKSVFADSVSEKVVGDIRHIRERMEFEVAKERGGLYNVKTGRGGLVDIEFIVQLLLLKYGGAKRELWTPNTAVALDRFKDAGILSEDEYEALLNAYNFLSKIQNRLRIVNDKSVSELDVNSRDFARLAKMIGCDDASLLSEYQRNTDLVRKIYDRYFTG